VCEHKNNNKDNSKGRRIDRCARATNEMQKTRKKKKQALASSLLFLSSSLFFNGSLAWFEADPSLARFLFLA
jgi:hypothetical protein